MLSKVFIPFVLAALTGVHAKPVFDFPDIIRRTAIPVSITVHEYNDTEAALGAAAVPKLEPRRSLEERGDCKGSRVCGIFVSADECLKASKVRYGNSNPGHRNIPWGKLVLSVEKSLMWTG